MTLASTLRTPLDTDPRDFSIILGGPLFQLLRRAHMTGDALELLRRRVAVLSLFAWLPLLLLSLLHGELFHGRAAVPFLLDVQVPSTSCTSGCAPLPRSFWCGASFWTRIGTASTT